MKLKHKIVHLFLAMMMTLSLIPSFSSPVIAAANENPCAGTDSDGIQLLS